MNQLQDRYKGAFCETIVGGVIIIPMITSNSQIVQADVTHGDFPNCSVDKFSDKIYLNKSFTNTTGIGVKYSTYTDIKEQSMGGIIVDDNKIYNLKKIQEIACLENDWNNNGAKSFDKELIAKVTDIVLGLKMQPEIFPIAGGSLQLEFNKQDESYLEMEIKQENIIEIFYVDSEQNEEIYQIEMDIEEVNKVVDGFYG